MVGHFLNGLDGFAIGFREVLDQAQQVGTRTGGQGLEFGKTGITQGDEPGHLNLDPALHVALLAHGGAEFGELGGVAAVQRGKGRYGRKSHAIL